MINRTKLKEKMNEDIDLISEIADETRSDIDDLMVKASLQIKSRYYSNMSPDEYIAFIGDVFYELRTNTTLLHLEGLTASLEAVNTKLLSVETRTNLTEKEGK